MIRGECKQTLWRYCRAEPGGGAMTEGRGRGAVQLRCNAGPRGGASRAPPAGPLPSSMPRSCARDCGCAPQCRSGRRARPSLSASPAIATRSVLAPAGAAQPLFTKEFLTAAGGIASTSQALMCERCVRMRVDSSASEPAAAGDSRHVFPVPVPRRETIIMQHRTGPLGHVSYYLALQLHRS